MLYGIFLGTLVVASSLCWPLAWLGLELNLLSFIPVAMPLHVNKKGAMLYFVAQSGGSLMVMLCGMMSDVGSAMYLGLLVGVVVKMGLMPMHFWVPNVVQGLSRSSLYLLLSWQKLGPLVLVSSLSSSLVVLSVVNAVGGAVSMTSVTILSMLLVFSGMLQMSWVLSVSGFFCVYYLAVYFVIMGVVVYYSTLNSLNFGWALLNAGGLPPLSGFMIKFKAIMQIKSWTVVLLVASSGLALGSYVRILMNAGVKSGVPTVPLVGVSALGMV
uniref:NADH-ubiquinone oxidoreductase chain 2 n=1 Tax=Parasagitta elegans TaxID=1562708 RepID=A0A141CLF4_9BILA|nr:NADH dehydrogenase subunit 2 [Parasagitta elegans]AKS04361.1 NADH dehydrogenase subunit 2 [Parasagitta elegans]AKS04392.1 NADH dehydrogenase subunit 2 [Parasagitta elegans]